MKTQGRTKGWTALGAALLLLGTLLAGTAAQASDRDSLTVTITPTVAYAVDLDTGVIAALLDLGAVGLGQSTYTVHVTTVEVQSSYVATDLTVQAQIISGVWNVDGDTTAAESDGLQSWAVFTDTSIATTGAAQALSGAFGANDLLQTTPRDVGNVGAGARMYEVASGDAGYKNMEDLPSSLAGDVPASRTHLWLKFKLPPTTSSAVAEQVYITVIAGAPN